MKSLGMYPLLLTLFIASCDDSKDSPMGPMINIPSMSESSESLDPVNDSEITNNNQMNNPISCEPAAEAVTILPRSSNHEIWRLYSDLTMSPIDKSLFGQWTPLAQVRGFDHMTEARIDVQTLEEQLRTTEAVSELLVNTPEVLANCPAPTEQVSVCPVYESYDAAAQFSGQQGADCWNYIDYDENQLVYDASAERWQSPTDAGLFIWRTGLHPGIAIDVIRRWQAPVDGQVSLRGSISDGDSGGGDGIIAEIRTAEGIVFQSVIVNGGAPTPYELSLNVQRGEFIDFIIKRNANNSWDSTGLNAVIDFTPTITTAGLDWANCGSELVNQVASRAWRRPLRPEELEDLKVVFDEVSASANQAGMPGSFTEGLKASLQAALLSPHVQYKPEFVPGGVRPEEDSYRRASRLSLFFRGSFPDDILWNLAASGPLSDDQLEAEASRLLSEDSSRFVENFGGQWLDFRGLLADEYTPLAKSMREEAHNVFATILDDGLPPVRLIEPGFTIVDGLLANHYGLGPISSGTEPSQIMTNERGGLLEQGHFLTSGATGSDFRRVIHRGIYTLNRTLCSTIPPLDPATLEEIAATAEFIDPELPLNERMQMHRESTDRCLGCHSQMDPLGLALEHFDAEGRWRKTYPDGSPIGHDFEFNGQSVQNPDELKELIIGSDLYQLCVAEKLFDYGLHRAPRNDERCLVNQIASIDQPERSLQQIAIDAFLSSLVQTEIP